MGKCASRKMSKAPKWEDDRGPIGSVSSRIANKVPRNGSFFQLLFYFVTSKVRRFRSRREINANNPKLCAA